MKIQRAFAFLRFYTLRIWAEDKNYIETKIKKLLKNFYVYDIIISSIVGWIMESLGLVGKKVVDKNGSVSSIISVNFSKKFIVELDNGKKYDISIAIPKGVLRFEDFALQKKIERGFSGEEVPLNKELSESNSNDFSDLSEDEAKIKLLELWWSYGFEGFLHTTELENFQRIINSGYLLSRNKAEGYIDRADKEVIEHTRAFVFDYCRFYYYFKTPTNYKAGYKNPVILVFSDDLIYNDQIIFCSGNAASKYTSFNKSAKDVLNRCWKAVFERGPYTASKYVHSEIGEWIIKNIRNAEFLLKDQVNINKICRVYFKTEADLNAAKLFSPEWLTERFFIDKDKFF